MRQTRLRLCDVGSGHLANLEAVARLPQLFLKDGDIVLAQIEDRGVAQHVHVGRRTVLQGILLGQPHRLARRIDLRLRLFRRVAGALAVVEILLDADADAARKA